MRLNLYFLVGMSFLFWTTTSFGQQLGCSKEKITRGLWLTTCQSKELFNSHQSFQILKLKQSRRLDLAFKSKELIPTSDFGASNNSLAAINAGFFDMKNGGSVTFLKANDEVVDTQRTKSNLLSNSLIAIDKNNRLHIISDSNWVNYSTTKQFEDVLFTGPLLLKDGRPTSLADVPFNQKRHPRTCICITKQHQTLLFTIDGRNDHAAGMSLPELTQLLKRFKCIQGINLDGGGSTTMWVRSKGVVNHPSDNKQFDHFGERKVANALLIY